MTYKLEQKIVVTHTFTYEGRQFDPGQIGVIRTNTLTAYLVQWSDWHKGSNNSLYRIGDCSSWYVDIRILEKHTESLVNENKFNLSYI